MKAFLQAPAALDPGLVRQVSQPAPADWTVVVDHFLLANLTSCTLCGGRPDVLDQVLARCGRVGLAVVYCLACRNADPQRERLRAKLDARYATGRFAPGAHGDTSCPCSPATNDRS
jgi:hypothetical protein